VYEALHPETRAHVAGAHASNRAQGNASANLAPAFTAATAAASGRSERSVQRDAERGDKITAEAIDLVSGTRLDTGSYLDELKQVPHDAQAERVRHDLERGRSTEEVQPGCSRSSGQANEPDVSELVADLRRRLTEREAKLKEERARVTALRRELNSLKEEIIQARQAGAATTEEDLLKLFSCQFLEAGRELLEHLDDSKLETSNFEKAALLIFMEFSALNVSDIVGIIQESGRKKASEILEKIAFERTASLRSLPAS
jgi:hypothetical protein